MKIFRGPGSRLFLFTDFKYFANAKNPCLLKPTKSVTSFKTAEENGWVYIGPMELGSWNEDTR